MRHLVAPVINYNNRVGVETFISLVHIVDLFADGYSANNKNKGNGKLKDNQHFSQIQFVVPI